MNPILGKPVHDIMQVKGRTKALTVSDTVQEVRVGDTRMENRKIVVIQNLSASDLDYGFESTLAYGQGLVLESGDVVSIAVSDNVPIYIVGPSGGLQVRIMEGY